MPNRVGLVRYDTPQRPQLRLCSLVYNARWTVEAAAWLPAGRYWCPPVGRLVAVLVMRGRHPAAIGANEHRLKTTSRFSQLVSLFQSSF